MPIEICTRVPQDFAVTTYSGTDQEKRKLDLKAVKTVGEVMGRCIERGFNFGELTTQIQLAYVKARLKSEAITKAIMQDQNAITPPPTGKQAQ